MSIEVEDAVKEYYDLKEKIKELEKRQSELKGFISSIFDAENTDELFAEDIVVYRVNHPRINWDESILKSILIPKSLWESVLAVDNKKVQDLIENRVISEQEIKKAKITIDIWYTYAERTSKYNKICFDNSLLIRETIGIKKLVITDLSRMKENKICIFGVDEEKKYIRPVIPTSGITERYIFDEKGNQIIKPFAEVEFDFIRPLPEPPHTEDWEINASYKPRLIRDLSENDIKRFLEEILDDSVKAIFGPTIYYNRHIKIGGNRSIGTIKVKKVHSVNYSIKESDKYNYRITFSDMSGEVYNLPITDYAFRKYCDSQRIQKGETTDFIRHKLQQIFNQSDLFLRVGLSRRYKDAYWLLISGLYTFPDYRKQDYGNRVFERDFEDKVSILLNDSDGNNRAKAAYLLGESKNPAFIEALCSATKDPDGNVRRLAASALGKIRDDRAIDALICLLRDSKPQVRQYAIKALGEIGSEKAIPELVKIKDDPIPYIKIAIETAITKIKYSNKT